MIKHKHVKLNADEFERLPFPYDWLVGAQVYSPSDGHGWIGMDEREDGVVLWFVHIERGARPIDYDHILFHQDKRTSNMWLVFLNTVRNEGYPYIIHPEEGVALHHIPRKLKEILNE